MKHWMMTLAALVLGTGVAVGAEHGAPGMDHGSMDHGAAGEMDHGAAGEMDHESMGAGDMFLERRTVNGLTVTFHVMEAPPEMNHGGTHNLMIKVERDGSPLTDLAMNSKVVFPGDGSRWDSKQPLHMGDWYMAGYDLGGSGRHQLLVVFRTAEGSRHSAGVYYPGP